MKRILVPTDFSECAEVAADTAITIAIKAKAEVYFLHLHAPEPTGGHMAMHGGDSHSGHHHDCTGQARAQLDRLVKKAECQGLSARPVLVLEENWEQVEKHVRAFSIDLVVMGSRGVNGFKEFFVMPNAQRMIRSARAPVLVIKRKNLPTDPLQIVFASSFEEDLQHAMEFLNSFASLWNATVHFVFINTHFNSKEADKILNNIKRWSATLSVPTQQSIFESKNEETGIREYAKQVGASVIALVTGKKTFMRIMFPDISKSMVNHEENPVLVINSNC